MQTPSLPNFQTAIEDIHRYVPTKTWKSERLTQSLTVQMKNTKAFDSFEN
jgi:hypothetical protein